MQLPRNCAADGLALLGTPNLDFPCMRVRMVARLHMARYSRGGKEVAMKRVLNSIGCSAVVGLVIVMLSRDAYGYLDPGTTNYVVQLLIAGVLGALFAIKVYWLKVRAFVVGLFSKRTKTEPEGKSEQE